MATTLLDHRSSPHSYYQLPQWLKLHPTRILEFLVLFKALQERTNKLPLCFILLVHIWAPPQKIVDLCFLEGEWCGGNHFRPLPYQRQQTLGTHLIRQLIEIARNGRTTKWTSIQLCNPQYLFFLSLANFQQLFSRMMITNSQLHEKGEIFLNKTFQLCNNLWRTYITNSKNKVARYGEISTTPLLPKG